MIECLLRHGADPVARDVIGMTPVMVICASIASGPALVDAAKVLLDNGGSAQCSNGVFTPMHTLSFFTGYAPLAKLLIDYNADVNYTCWGKSIAASMLMNAALVRVWVGYRSSFDEVLSESNGATCLHMAAFMDQAEICHVYLEARADPGIRNIRGKTALDVACDLKSYSVEALLRSHAGLTQ
jgi:ankyrin repeat protein